MMPSDQSRNHELGDESFDSAWAVEVHAHWWQQLEAEQHSHDPFGCPRGIDAGADLAALWAALTSGFHSRSPA